MKLLRFILLICLCGFFNGYAEEKLSEPAFQFKGQHFLASYCDCDHEAMTNLKALEQAMLKAAEKAARPFSNLLPGNSFQKMASPW